MRINKQFALVSGEDVFGIVHIHTLYNQEDLLAFESGGQFVEIPNTIPVEKDWKYENGEFIAPEVEVEPRRPQSVFSGWALVKDGVVSTVTYFETDDDITQRYIAGFSSDAYIVPIPDDVDVFVGDKWDGSTFN